MAFNIGDKVQLTDGRKGVVASVLAGNAYAITLDPGPILPSLHPVQPTDAVPEKMLTKIEGPVEPRPAAPTNPGVLSLQVGDRVRLLDGRTGVVARVNVDGTNYAVTIDQPTPAGQRAMPTAKDTATDSVPAGVLTKLPSTATPPAPTVHPVAPVVPDVPVRPTTKEQAQHEQTRLAREAQEAQEAQQRRARDARS